MTNINIYIVANWKMYGVLSSINTIKNVITLSKKKSFQKAKIIYCPPYTLLRQFINKTKNTKISIGAQNCHTENKYGSFTGSISASMIKNIGCKYVIIGHSENRIVDNSEKKINLKIKSALKENLNVIFCIGETLLQKKNKKTNIILKKQLLNGLKGIKKIENILVSYEPVWSIGTGIVPKFDELKKQIKYIKKILNSKYRGKRFKILYGGSVNPENIVTLKQIRGINGYLVGGASQNQKKFIDIIKKSIN